MTKTASKRKERLLAKGEGQMEMLAAQGREVSRFSTWHFRVDGRLDVWPSSQVWFDRETRTKGKYEDLMQFVENYLPTHEKNI